MSARGQVREALQALSREGTERLGRAAGLFSSWVSATAVAERAGVSVTTARRYLDELAGCRGYARHRFKWGGHGYRHYAD